MCIRHSLSYKVGSNVRFYEIKFTPVQNNAHHTHNQEGTSQHFDELNLLDDTIFFTVALLLCTIS